MTAVDVARTSVPAARAEGRSRTDGDRTEPALRAAIDSLPDPVRHIAGYHRGWWDKHGAPTTGTGGKAIRPALAMLSASAVGAGTDPDRAVPAAVAVELVHDFSLLHDDVLDRDLTRRHRPTAWAVFGSGAAILAGDALVNLAMDVLAGSGHPAASQGVRLLSAAVRELLEGQVADLAFERRDDVALAECLRMAEAKTGALLGGSCALGALFAAAPAGSVEEMRRYGRELGLAFQLVDDLLGIWGDPGTTGKPARSDLRRRKKSIPVVAALTSGTSAGAELAELYGRDELSEVELCRAATLVELAGGRAWCRDRAAGLADSALRRLPADSPATTELRGLTRLVLDRDH